MGKISSRKKIYPIKFSMADLYFPLYFRHKNFRENYFNKNYFSSSRRVRREEHENGEIFFDTTIGSWDRNVWKFLPPSKFLGAAGTGQGRLTYATFGSDGGKFKCLKTQSGFVKMN